MTAPSSRFAPRFPLRTCIGHEGEPCAVVFEPKSRNHVRCNGCSTARHKDQVAAHHATRRSRPKPAQAKAAPKAVYTRDPFFVVAFPEMRRELEHRCNQASIATPIEPSDPTHVYTHNNDRTTPGRPRKSPTQP